MSEGDTPTDDEPPAGGSEQPSSAAAGEATSGWDAARAGDESNAAQAGSPEGAGGAQETPDGYQPPAYQPPAQQYAYPVTAPRAPYPGQPGGPPPPPSGTAPPGPPGPPPYGGPPPPGAYIAPSTPSAQGTPPAPGPPGVYGPPMYGHPPTDGFAISSLVLSLMALVTCGLTALPGIICGHVALSRIKREPQRFGGHGLALAGTIIGWVLLILIIGFFALVLGYLGVHGCFGNSPPADCN